MAEKMMDRLFPFIHDRAMRSYYRQWKHARAEEIARKLAVCRVGILNGVNVAAFTMAQDVLWRIDTERQRRIARRGLLKEVAAWLRIPGIVVGFAVAITTIAWILGLW